MTLHYNTYAHTHTHTHTHTYMHACTQACMHTRMHACMRAYTHTYTHAYITYTQMEWVLRAPWLPGGHLWEHWWSAGSPQFPFLPWRVSSGSLRAFLVPLALLVASSGPLGVLHWPPWRLLWAAGREPGSNTATLFFDVAVPITLIPLTVLRGALGLLCLGSPWPSPRGPCGLVGVPCKVFSGCYGAPRGPLRRSLGASTCF